MAKNHKIAPEVREQIVNRIKHDGISIKQAAEEHGISDRAIYNWLGKSTDGGPKQSELVKLGRERQELLTLIGELTLKLSETQKKK